MFENYSLADLWANIYKKWKWNVALFIVLSCAIAVPLLARALNTPATEAIKTNTSTTLFYRIDAPNEQHSMVDKSAKYGGYSDFYYYLIQNNINGAFLFNDVSDSDMKQLSEELNIATQTLKNSNFELWDNKIVVSTLSENRGVVVKILTTSKKFNDLVAEKVNQLITQYQHVYDNVTISQVDPVNAGLSQDVIQAGKRASVKQLAVRGGAAIVVAAFIVVALNVGLYIFNPTINQVADIAKYGMPYVYEIDTIQNALAVVKVNQSDAAKVTTFVSSSDKVLKRLEQALAGVEGQYQLVNAADVVSLANAEEIVFVEEFGTTRYRQFEQRLNVIASLNKQAKGTIVYPL